MTNDLIKRLRRPEAGVCDDMRLEAADALEAAGRVIEPFAEVGGALRGPSVEYSVRAPGQTLPVVSAKDFVAAFSWQIQHGQRRGRT